MWRVELKLVEEGEDVPVIHLACLTQSQVCVQGQVLELDVGHLLDVFIYIELLLSGRLLRCLLLPLSLGLWGGHRLWLNPGCRGVIVA